MTITARPGLKDINKMDFIEIIRRLIIYVPDHVKTQEMCNDSVRIKPLSLAHVPDRFKTQEMCIEAVARNPYTLKYIPDHLKTQEMCNEAVEKNHTC